MAKSKLEELADIYRVENLIKNTYQKTESKKYTPTHANATSDGDSKGKGTGGFLDTFNGGSDIDIKGNPSIPGSGRLPMMSQNEAQWGYGPDSPYGHPDTDGNEDQYRAT